MKRMFPIAGTRKCLTSKAILNWLMILRYIDIGLFNQVQGLLRFCLALYKNRKSLSKLQPWCTCSLLPERLLLNVIANKYG